MTVTTKICTKCAQIKTIEHFSPILPQHMHRPRMICNDCKILRDKKMRHKEDNLEWMAMYGHHMDYPID